MFEIYFDLRRNMWIQSNSDLFGDTPTPIRTLIQQLNLQTYFPRPLFIFFIIAIVIGLVSGGTLYAAEKNFLSLLIPMVLSVIFVVMFFYKKRRFTNHVYLTVNRFAHECMAIFSTRLAIFKVKFCSAKGKIVISPPIPNFLPSMIFPAGVIVPVRSGQVAPIFLTPDVSIGAGFDENFDPGFGQNFSPMRVMPMQLGSQPVTNLPSGMPLQNYSPYPPNQQNYLSQSFQGPTLSDQPLLPDSRPTTDRQMNFPGQNQNNFSHIRPISERAKPTQPFTTQKAPENLPRSLVKVSKQKNVKGEDEDSGVEDYPSLSRQDLENNLPKTPRKL